ncbi:MAG: hypothetical protein ABEI52_08745 [Halobacteriaceae archaeon]
MTDVYQLGTLVYALLTGSLPVTGGRMEVMKTVIGNEPVAPPSTQRADLSVEVDAAVALALERHKSNRFDSVSEFKKVLGAIRTGERLPPVVTTRHDE